MDKVKDAKKKCPNLIAVHVATYKEGEKEPGYWDNVDTRTHKVSLDLYRRESGKIINIFKETLPSGEIEKASIDEAFIDLTRPVREKLLERYPYLSRVPDDAPDGADSPLPPPPPINWSQLGVLIPVVTRDDDSEAKDEAPNYEDYHKTTWHDVALSIGAELMSRVREEVCKQLGYTTSALSASYKKPNSQVSSFRELTKEMQNKFGENAIWVYELLRGIDRSEVKEKSALFKSMLASKNLPKPITKPAEGQHWIRVLAAELALRLKDAREEMPTLWPKTIVLHARKGYETSRSKQAAFPFTRDITVDIIASAGNKLWKELVGDTTNIYVTSVQLAFTGIDAAETGQQNIDGFFKTNDVQRPTLKRPRSGASPSRGVVKGDSRDNQNQGEPFAASFVCERCCKRIALRDEQADWSEEQRISALAILRQEHEDFHFAQDLANESGPVIKPSSSSKPTSKSSKPTSKRGRETEPKGIEKFFGKK
ncbi:hypothetical protein ID866_10789 [Astraeus odoratus]|nr:hypothetical protein ID866_10789 [Astraeus odoratus]